MPFCNCNQGRLPCSCKPPVIRVMGASPLLAAPFSTDTVRPAGDLYAQFGAGLVKDNSSLEFDGALAAFHAAVWAAAADEELRTAYDEAGLREAKVLIGMYRAAAAQTVDRDAFEADYADWSGRDLQNILEQRLSDTYGQPKIAHAWRWYQHGKGVPL